MDPIVPWTMRMIRDRVSRSAESYMGIPEQTSDLHMWLIYFHVIFDTHFFIGEITLRIMSIKPLSVSVHVSVSVSVFLYVNLSLFLHQSVFLRWCLWLFVCLSIYPYFCACLCDCSRWLCRCGCFCGCGVVVPLYTFRSVLVSFVLSVRVVPCLWICLSISLSSGLGFVTLCLCLCVSL